MSRSRNPPPRGQGAARAKQVTPFPSDDKKEPYMITTVRMLQQLWFSVLLCLAFCFSQMGLLLDLNPDDGIDDGGNDEELEAELLQLMGGGGGGGGRSQGRKSEGKSEELISLHHTVNTRGVMISESHA